MSDQGLAMSARPGSGKSGPAALGGRAIMRAGALSTGALVVLGVSRLAHGSLISHATGASTYGLIGSLIGITYVAALFVPAGLASAMAKYVAQHRGKDDAAGARSAYRFLRRLSDASALTLGVLAAVVANLLYPVSVGQTVQVGLLAAVFSAYSVDKAAFYGFDRVARYSILEFAGSGLAIVATIIVITVDSTWYLAPLILGYAIVVVGSRLSLRGAVPARNAVDRKEFLTFAGLAAIGAGSAAGLLQGTPLLANWFTDARNGVSGRGAAASVDAEDQTVVDAPSRRADGMVADRPSSGGRR